MKKKRPTKTSHIVAGAALALALAMAGVSTATAATNPMAAIHPNNMVTLIATRFNLNAADVQKVFDEERAQMEAAHSQQFTDRINQAVTAGKLTQDQATKILAKKVELDAQRPTFASLEGKTDAEKRELMKAQADSLKTWATANNIPAEYFPFGKMGKRGGFNVKIKAPAL